MSHENLKLKHGLTDEEILEQLNKVEFNKVTSAKIFLAFADLLANGDIASEAEADMRIPDKPTGRRFYGAKVIFETDICTNGNSYLTIYGKHINGYFCCIPNWNISCEMAEPSDTFYNAEKLRCAGFDELTARKLAKEIADVAKQLDGVNP